MYSLCYYIISNCMYCFYKNRMHISEDCNILYTNRLPRTARLRKKIIIYVITYNVKFFEIKS